MMFKYPRFISGRETWRLLDGVTAAEWCKGYVVRLEGEKETGRGETTLSETASGSITPRGHDSFHVQLENPEYVREDEPVGCVPAMLEMSPECYERLRSGEVEWIEVIVVMLTGPKGDTCEYAVHSGYLLNDDGKTIEKLYVPANVG